MAHDKLFGGNDRVFSDHRHTVTAKDGSSDLVRKKSERLRFMIELYDMVDGFDAQPVETVEIAAKLGLDTSNPEDLLEVLKIIRYLHGEELLIASGPSGKAPRLNLTHKGVREVEESRGSPTLSTEHFPPLDEIGAVLGDHSSGQNGTAGAGDLVVLAESDRLEVLRMARSLQEWADRLSLEKEQRAAYDADIRTIEAQLDSPHPKTALIKVALESITSTAKEANAGSGFVDSIVSLGIASAIDRLVARL